MPSVRWRSDMPARARIVRANARASTRTHPQNPLHTSEWATAPAWVAEHHA